MDQVMAVFSWIVANWQIVLANTVTVIASIIALCTIIPGVNAHIGWLQSVINFLKRINIGGTQA